MSEALAQTFFPEHEDFNQLIDALPERVKIRLSGMSNLEELLEVVLDLGRQPEIRFLDITTVLDVEEITQQDLECSIGKIGMFGSDNRAGIERTLHRISAIRNRAGKVVGITFRVGRAVFGTIRVIEDLILSGRSVLLLGKPGVGKTTMLREVARVLSDDAKKRVIIVDTSNEIAGDGDIPHDAIGRARRMQVPSPTQQHDVMIEAVENHTPEVIVIDEIGTELEANAARTIAERGVQLVATAHGNTLENIMQNPTLSDLVGGIQTVTLGDIEARRRRTQKTVLERNAPPTFEMLVEIQGWNLVTVHTDVANTVDRLLRNQTIGSEIRALEADGTIRRQSIWSQTNESKSATESLGDSNGQVSNTNEDPKPEQITNVLPYGVNKGRIDQVVKSSGAPINLVADMKFADIVVTTKNYHRRGTQALRNAEKMGKPVFVLRKNTAHQIEQFIRAISKNSNSGKVNKASKSIAILDVEKAIHKITSGLTEVELKPQNSHFRRLQHGLAQESGMNSISVGIEPERRVVVSSSP